jgi:hypothetical protein
MKENEIKKNLEKILEDDNFIPHIYFPTLNQIPKKDSKTGNYIFSNGETFHGIIVNKIFQKGVYTWPNGQIYSGHFSNNNTFNGKGKIIFPDKSELTGVFNGESNTIEKASYQSATKIYSGSFKNNKFNGKFHIKDNEKLPNYLFIGNFTDGVKNGKFYLEKKFDNKTIKITGNYKMGKKNGEFIIYIMDNNEEGKVNQELKLNFFMDIEKKIYPEKEKIENKKVINFNCADKNNNIYCMEIFEDENNKYLLLGSYEKLIIYNIDDSQITFNTKISLFKKSDINDILKIIDNEDNKDKKILICSSNNKFKLIKLNLKKQFYVDNSYKITPNQDENHYELLQEFEGLKNSNSIFCLTELSNKLIISGDCENLILWRKKAINYNEESKLNNTSIITSHSKKPVSSNFFDRFISFLFDKIEPENIKENKENKEIFYEYIANYPDLTHTYSILEIKKKENENIIISVPQPDSKSLIFFEIDENNNIIKDINQIYDIDSIPNRKNIMALINTNLFVACKNKIVIIDINKYEINISIMFDTVTYISAYLNKYLIMGVMKCKNKYSQEAFLAQKELFKSYLMDVSEFTKNKFNGTIINACIYNNNLIIAIGSDRKILLLN